MTAKEKIIYMDIALRIAGYSFRHKDIAMFISLYDQLLDTKGETTLNATLKVKSIIDKEYNDETIEQSNISQL